MAKPYKTEVSTTSHLCNKMLENQEFIKNIDEMDKKGFSKINFVGKV